MGLPSLSPCFDSSVPSGGVLVSGTCPDAGGFSSSVLSVPSGAGASAGGGAGTLGVIGFSFTGDSTSTPLVFNMIFCGSGFLLMTYIAIKMTTAPIIIGAIITIYLLKTKYKKEKGIPTSILKKNHWEIS